MPWARSPSPVTSISVARYDKLLLPSYIAVVRPGSGAHKFTPSRIEAGKGSLARPIDVILNRIRVKGTAFRTDRP